MDFSFSDSDAEPSSSSRKKPSSSPKKSSKKPSAVDNILMGLSDDSDYEIRPKKITKADSSEDKALLAAKQTPLLSTRNNSLATLTPSSTTQSPRSRSQTQDPIPRAGRKNSLTTLKIQKFHWQAAPQSQQQLKPSPGAGSGVSPRQKTSISQQQQQYKAFLSHMVNMQRKSATRSLSSRWHMHSNI